MKIALKKPLTVGSGEGAVTITEVDLSKLDQMTGADIAKAVRECSSRTGKLVTSLVIDHEFHLELAAAACGLSTNKLSELHPRDYVEVVTEIQSFLTR